MFIQANLVYRKRMDKLYMRKS